MPRFSFHKKDMYESLKIISRIEPGKLDILFMGDYAEVNPDVVLRTALKEGYDCVLIDSLAEISDSYVEQFGGSVKSNTNRILQLLDEHNQGNNEDNINTTFSVVTA